MLRESTIGIYIEGIILTHPSDSSVQKDAEKKMLRKLEKEINCSLTEKQIEINHKLKLELDGYSESECILCEAYAHIGKLRGAQPRKVLADAIKLLYAERLLPGIWRKILLFADDKAAQPFKNGTWYAEAIKEFGIEIRVSELKEKTRKKLEETQKTQKMQNIG